MLKVHAGRNIHNFGFSCFLPTFRLGGIMAFIDAAYSKLQYGDGLSGGSYT